MDWMELFVPLIALMVGYFLGIRRDQSSAIRTKQIEAMTQLHERVLEIERKEMSDGKSITFVVPVHGGTKKRSGLLSEEEATHCSRLSHWRQELNEEENRARLWIDRGTVYLVSTYFLLMMHCKNWEEFGQGNLTEDKDFLHYLRCIFGSTGNVLRKVIIPNSTTGDPWLVDCVRLSALCLKVIQRRVRLEVSSPFWFRLKSLWWRWLEWQERKKSSEKTSFP